MSEVRVLWCEMTGYDLESKDASEVRKGRGARLGAVRGWSAKAERAEVRLCETDCHVEPESWGETERMVRTTGESSALSLE